MRYAIDANRSARQRNEEVQWLYRVEFDLIHLGESLS